MPKIQRKMTIKGKHSFWTLWWIFANYAIIPYTLGLLHFDLQSVHKWYCDKTVYKPVFLYLNIHLNGSKDSIIQRNRSFKIARVPFATSSVTISKCVHAIALFSTFMPWPFIAMAICKVIYAKSMYFISKILARVFVSISTTKTTNWLASASIHCKKILRVLKHSCKLYIQITSCFVFDDTRKLSIS